MIGLFFLFYVFIGIVVFFVYADSGRDEPFIHAVGWPFFTVAKTIKSFKRGWDAIRRSLD